MMKFIKTGLFTVLSTGCLAAPALADYFFVQDPVHQFTLSYPDRWERVINQKPDDVMTIAAPGKDFASCRLRVREDGRFQIYPARFSDNLIRTEFGQDFWEKYLAENVAYRINDIHIDSGFGRGHASHVHANYVSYDDPGQQKQAIIFASLYNNKIYVIDCSSTIESFQSWYPHFTSIVKSVDFRKEEHEVPNGEYRPFLKDCPTWVRNGPDVRSKRDEDLKRYW